MSQPNVKSTPDSIPSLETRIALYENVNEQLRFLKSEQWKIAVLALTLILGVGTLVIQRQSILDISYAKIGLTFSIILMGLFGSIQVARLQAFLSTHKSVRKLLEQSFGMNEWEQLSGSYSLLNKSEIKFFGDWFELLIWGVALIIFETGTLFIIWQQ